MPRRLAAGCLLLSLYSMQSTFDLGAKLAKRKN